MISRKTIKKYKLDAPSLKKVFTAEVPDPNIAKLRQLIADRIKDGRLRALSEYKLWAAVDFAYEAPLNQTTPTLLRHLMDKGGSAKDVLAALETWGISQDTLFTKESNQDGTTVMNLNVPMFFGVFVPLVKSYLTIRLAKIFNDRNLTPLFEFPPREYTAENRAICKVLEQVVESIAIDFDYASTLRSFIFNALMYSVSIKFPMEPWYKEIREDDGGEEVVEKEGVRYAIPHISRTYYDITHPPHTLNTGTGSEFAGYWTILKWGNVVMDKRLWNKNAVPHGTNWLDPNAAWYNYFKEVYPCTMKFPHAPASRKTDRENMAFRYTRTDFDSAFFLTYHFQKLVPSDWGISDYDKPVWMRFIIGGDDTIMYAEVFPYHPVDYIGYDSDANRGRNSSLALEIIPFQDMVGNALNQLIQTVKRNLVNIVFYDTDAVNKDHLESINRNKNQQYSSLNFVGYSGLEMERGGGRVEDLFKKIDFGFADTTQILTQLNTIIALLERVLGMSAQETGSSASHQQSKKEVEITQGSSTNRLAYTASFVDIGVDFWKRHLAEAAIMHMDGREVVATIPTDIPNLPEVLAKIGFEFVDGAPGNMQKEVAVKGKIDGLRLVQYVARRSDAARQNDSQVATLMMQTIQMVANSPIYQQIIDPVSLIELLEYAAKLAGADDDFKIRVNPNGQTSAQLQQVVTQIQQTVMAAVEKEVVEPTSQAISQTNGAVSKNAQETAQAIAQLNSKLEQIQQAISASQPPPAPQPPVPPPAPQPPVPPPAPIGIPA